MNEILSCPFCGGKPYLESDSRGFIRGESKKICYVRCLCCGARSPRLDLTTYKEMKMSKEALKKVIRSWNMRTVPSFRYEIVSDGHSRWHVGSLLKNVTESDDGDGIA